ncbi:MAG: KxYKxGKxW signal peptide domain-containing protein [Gammaproteobacteria bacterium]|nr:KxYKxGKxW signal peptide domain-containing protein [Gammaproteobacteria bacterium]
MKTAAFKALPSFLKQGLHGLSAMTELQFWTTRFGVFELIADFYSVTGERFDRKAKKHWCFASIASVAYAQFVRSDTCC